jgi:hypothetical protein
MSIHEEMASDAAQIFAEFGKPVEISGTTVSALISEPTETVSLEPGGFVAEGNFTVKVLRASVSELPKIGDIVSYNAERFRIVRTANRPPHPIVTLTVEPVE